MFSSAFRWLSLIGICGGCAGRAPASTVLPARGDAAHAQGCSTPVPAGREATQEELLGLILPRYEPHVGLPALRLPTSAFASEGFVVEPCLGPQIPTLEPPSLGRVERLRLDERRELVQFSVGTQAGMVGYTVGVLALLLREHGQLRLLATQQTLGPLEAGLAFYRRARFGSVEVLLQTTSTGPEHEDYTGGTSVSVYQADSAGLKWLGSMSEREVTHEVFWRGPFDYVMTSGGPEPEAAGFVVHEAWTFVNRATHARTSRTLDRHYTLRGEQVVATPAIDPEVWPETSLQGWPSAFEAERP